MKASDYVLAFPTPASIHAWETQAVADGKAMPEPVWTAVPVSSQAAWGAFYVTPDVFSVGPPGDSMRMPLTPGSAQQIADAHGWMLPTTRMIDAMTNAAPRRIAPSPLIPNLPSDIRPAGFYRHSKMVDQALAFLPAQSGLIMGSKKAVVLTNALLQHPGRVAIYGWPQLNGTMIQGLNPSDHDANYVDYSHGIWFVHPQMMVNGATMNTADVLRDPKLSSLVSKEGPLHFLRYPTPMNAVATTPPAPVFVPAAYVQADEPPPVLPPGTDIPITWTNDTAAPAGPASAPTSKGAGVLPWIFGLLGLGALARGLKSRVRR